MFRWGVLGGAMTFGFGALLLSAVTGLLWERDVTATNRSVAREASMQLQRGVVPDGLLIPSPRHPLHAVVVTDSDRNIVGRTPELLAATTNSGTTTIVKSRVNNRLFTFTVTAPKSANSARLGTLRWTLLSVAALLSMLCGLVMRRVAQIALRPVHALMSEARKAAPPARLSIPNTNDEVAELAHGLNDLLDRVEQNNRLQVAFLADASHELRSPLAALRVLCETAPTNPLSSAALEQSVRLEQLVDGLLRASRSDRRTPRRRETIDLDELVIRSVRTPRRLPIELSTIQPFQIRGDASILSSAIDNVIDNAARHARSTVKVFLHSSEAKLIIDDDGPGIPSSEAERVFERFTRLEPDRSPTRTGGLGLSIVRQGMRQHGGDAHIERSPLGGARIILQFRPESLDDETILDARSDNSDAEMPKPVSARLRRSAGLPSRASDANR
jgi:signal transduction histidine kinase